MLNAMEHPIFCCDRRLGEVLMPGLGRVQDHQRAAVFGHHALKMSSPVLASKLTQQSSFWLDVDNDTDVEWAQWCGVVVEGSIEMLPS